MSLCDDCIHREVCRWEVSNGEPCEDYISNTIYIIPEQTEKPIKIISHDVAIKSNNDNSINIIKKLSPLETKKLFIDLFGTTDVGVLSCNDMSDEELNRMLDELNSIPEEYVVPIEEWKRLEYTNEEAIELSEHSNICG